MQTNNKEHKPETQKQNYERMKIALPQTEQANASAQAILYAFLS